MLSRLKQIGQLILKVSAVVTGFIPYARPIAALTPTTADDRVLTEMSAAIQTVEAVGQAVSMPGTDKLAAATPLVSQALLKYTDNIGEEVADPALFQRACNEYAQATADFWNSLKHKQ